MIAGDPDPLATTHQREQLFAVEPGHTPCPTIVVKTVTETENGCGTQIVDDGSQPVERRSGVIGRQQIAPSRRRRSFFQMEVRDDQQAQIGQEQGSTRIAQRMLTRDGYLTGARYNS